MRRTKYQIQADIRKRTQHGARNFFAVFSGGSRGCLLHTGYGMEDAKKFISLFEKNVAFVLREWVPGTGFVDRETFCA